MMKTPVAVLFSLAFLMPAYAHEEGHEMHIEGHKHEHGVADLRVGVTNNTVLIELESPMDNVVGFEHEPSDSAQQQAIDQAAGLLNSGADLFALPVAANCALNDVQLEVPFYEGEYSDKSTQKRLKARHAHNGEHSDAYVAYTFECSKAEQVDGINVGLFDIFPRLEKIRAVSVSDYGQTAAELSKGDAQLPVKNQ